jgi:hypothetical protein
MAISSLLTTITDEISALSISGVTIKDYDGIVANWASTPYVLYLNPENPLTGFSPDYKSFLHGALAQVDLNYTLNYRFLGTQVGNLGNTAVAYSDVVNKVVLIINAAITNHSYASGKASVELGAVTFGPRTDPAGNSYHGADIALTVSEMQNT